MDLKVGFVYDEFMEYIIAKALWFKLSGEFTKIDCDKVVSVSADLLRIKERFISVRGVVIYLGEILASISKQEGLKYVDWLISNSYEDLACRLIVRWPKATLSNSVFVKLLDLHKSGRSEESR